MAKRTGFLKTLGRKDYVVVPRINRLPQSPWKETITVLDFSHNPQYHGKS